MCLFWLPASPQVADFQLEAGETVLVTGGIPQLGNWQPDQMLHLAGGLTLHTRGYFGLRAARRVYIALAQHEYISWREDRRTRIEIRGCTWRAIHQGTCVGACGRGDWRPTGGAAGARTGGAGQWNGP